MKILNFQIPSFRSLAWVSDEACEKWEYLFRKINSAIIQTAVTGVAQEKWMHRSLRVHGMQYIKTMGLAKQYGIDLKASPVNPDNTQSVDFYDIVLAKTAAIDLTSGCCAQYSLQKVTFPRKEMLWESALASTDAKISEGIIEIESGIMMGGFWQQVLVNPTLRTQCRMDCRESVELQEENIEYMRTLGYKEEADLLEEIYSWPVEWSAAHGICELKTPVIKIAYDTDATEETYKIRIMGSAYPEEGLEGLNFPYRRRKFLKITDSKSFKNGLAHGAKLKS